MTTPTRVLPDPAAEPTIDARRVASILGISRNGAYEAIQRGEVPSIRVGRSVRVPTARFLAAFGLAPAPASDLDTDGGPVPAGQRTHGSRISRDGGT